MTLYLATGNAGKLRELAARLEPIGLTLLPPPADAPSVDETEPTLAGNARLKAEALARHTGVPCLADDTGLEVDALGGRPGVYSARYAGPACDPADNRALLLREMDGVADRTARFRTSLAFAHPGEPTRTFDGVCEGRIADEPSGDGGFGYDVLFVPRGESETFAQMSTERKNAISHRGRALDAFESFARTDLIGR
jgi:XTP/dITP diphosphohydrolase